MPNLLHYLKRWDRAWDFTELSLAEQFFFPLCFILTWQILYFAIQFTYIEKDKTLVTTFRHFCGSPKSHVTKLCTKVAILFGKLHLKKIMWEILLTKELWLLSNIYHFRHYQARRRPESIWHQDNFAAFFNSLAGQYILVDANSNYVQ